MVWHNSDTEFETTRRHNFDIKNSFLSFLAPEYNSIKSWLCTLQLTCRLWGWSDNSCGQVWRLSHHPTQPGFSQWPLNCIISNQKSQVAVADICNLSVWVRAKFQSDPRSVWVGAQLCMTNSYEPSIAGRPGLSCCSISLMAKTSKANIKDNLNTKMLGLYTFLECRLKLQAGLCTCKLIQSAHSCQQSQRTPLQLTCCQKQKEF